MKNTTIQRKHMTQRLLLWAIAATIVLSIPVVTKAPWTELDYSFAGVVLFGAATIYEIATKNMPDKKDRIYVCAAVLTVLILIWGWAVS